MIENERQHQAERSDDSRIKTGHIKKSLCNALVRIPVIGRLKTFSILPAPNVGIPLSFSEMMVSGIVTGVGSDWPIPKKIRVVPRPVLLENTADAHWQKIAPLKKSNDRGFRSFAG